MVKKIMAGVVFAGMLAILVIGGINRTMAKTSDGYRTGSGVGTRAGQLDQFEESIELHDQSDYPVRRGLPGRQGGGGRQNENNDGQLNLAEDQFTELVYLEGIISNVDMSEQVVIDTNDGLIILEGRSLSFAVSQGFSAQAGNEVMVEGFYEGDDFEIVQITNRTSGLVTTLREPTGRPLWAGGGRTW